MGAPASPHAHGVVPNRSSSRVEKRIEAGCWPVWSTFTAKCDALMRAAALAALLAMQTSSSGGSSDTEVKLLTVRPVGPPSCRHVTTVTPVAKHPSASRRVRGSCPLRYSCRVGWSAMPRRYNAPRLERQQPVGSQRQYFDNRLLERHRDEIERLEC